jgi:FkbM family methyltransferase
MLADCNDAISLISALERQYSSMSINWEAILASQYRASLKAPRTIVDVGANEGAHTAHFANMGAQRIVGFEPIPELARALTAKFGDNPRLEIHSAALSTSDGKTKFHINRDIPTHSSLELRSDADSASAIETIDVEVKRLDTFNLTDVDFIKLDCEGAELDVLKGAVTTLAYARPLISIEYGAASYVPFGYQQRSLFDWATQNAYVVTDLFGFPLGDLATFQTCVDRYYWDYLLVPGEKRSVMLAALAAGRKQIFENFKDYVVGG